MDSNGNSCRIMNKKLEIAGITTDEKKRLIGVKVLGVFPFYLSYIKTGTHVQLCGVKEQIQKVVNSEEPKISDFYNYKIQKEVEPLIQEYILTALINQRKFQWFYRMVLTPKIKQCSHSQILNLYSTIRKLDEPAFFLTYWNWINQEDHTLLKEVKPS